MKKLIITAVIILSGCSTTATQCFLEVGVGGFLNADNLEGNTPAEANAYCTKENVLLGGDISAGVYHNSDLLHGKPFNKKYETSTDRIMLKYRKRVW